MDVYLEAVRLELGEESVDGLVVGGAELGDDGPCEVRLGVELLVGVLEMAEVEVVEDDCFAFWAVGEVGVRALSRGWSGVGSCSVGHVVGCGTQVGWLGVGSWLRGWWIFTSSSL